MDGLLEAHCVFGRHIVVLVAVVWTRCPQGKGFPKPLLKALGATHGMHNLLHIPVHTLISPSYHIC
jgi:hypothetical protein